jgi:hypothetical protein
MANKNVPSLDGLIQTKGAPRPDTMSQRGESPAREIQAHLQAAVTPRQRHLRRFRRLLRH